MQLVSDWQKKTGVDFPEGLSIDIDIEDEFDSFPFRRVGLYRIDGPVLLEFECDDSDSAGKMAPEWLRPSRSN